MTRTAFARFDTWEAKSFHHCFAHAESEVELHWNARNHRKQRLHPLRGRIGPGRSKHHYRLLAWRWHSLPWWVAAVFTLGSLSWLINGASIVWPPSASPELSALTPIWSAFIGGLIFVIGAYLSWLEVLNAPRYVALFADDSDDAPGAGPTTIATGNENGHQIRRDGRADIHSAAIHDDNHRLRWLGWRPPTWGWWLNAIQLLGALVFFVPCTVGALLATHPRIDAFAWVWLPQMLGACCFIIASGMAMRELQDRPWRPAWHHIGWWPGLFNLLGAIGFFLCAWFGFHSRFENPSLSNLTTFTGSVCFLISSYLLLVEVINPEGPR